MKKVLIASLITTAFCFVAAAQEHTRPVPSPIPKSSPIPLATPLPNPDGWVTFNSAPGKFSVLMPEIPTDKAETTQTEQGPYTTHLFIVRGAKSAYLIGWVDYDPDFNFNPSRELEMNRENFIKGVNATLVSNRSLTIDGYQSLEFTAESADTVFKSRVYMVGRRPYQLVAATAKGVDDSSNISRFFGSFKVRPR